MSLTDLLRDEHGPVFAFLASRLPNLRGVEDRWRRAGPPAITPSSDVALDVIGAAFDYRLRFFFSSPPLRALAAGHGARLLREVPDGQLVADAFEDLADEMDQRFCREPLTGGVLDPGVERSLARLCYVLALFEAHYRRPGAHLEEPLATLSVATGGALLALVPSPAVDDLVALARAFAGTHAALLRCPHRSNPVFAGSGDVGGADGDIVIGTTLVEIKTTLRRTPKPAWVYQLAGYALLDYEDQLQLDEVAFYLARIPALISWPIDRFFTELAGHLVDLQQTRAEFGDVARRSRPRRAS